MSVTTYQIASFANGICRVEIDIDDNLRVRKGRVINDSNKSAYLGVYKAGLLAFSQGIPPHETIERNLPAAIKFIYREYDPDDPDDEGTMTMGDIKIFTRWGGS